jgi:hypothetical protein
MLGRVATAGGVESLLHALLFFAKIVFFNKPSQSAKPTVFLRFFLLNF